MKALTNLLVAVALTACASTPSLPEKPMIQLEQLQAMFQDMRAKAPWNVDGPLLWGYFFTDRNPEKLKPVCSFLEQQGYRLVGIYEARNKLTFVLHVEKIEHHTPESLDARNREFYRLAHQYKLDSYDGMDVGSAS